MLIRCAYTKDALKNAQDDLLSKNAELAAAQEAEEKARADAEKAGKKVTELEHAQEELKKQLETEQGDKAAVQSKLDQIQKELSEAQAAKDKADQAVTNALKDKEAAETRALEAEAKLEEMIKASEENEKKNLKNAEVTGFTEMPYTGEELTPAVTVKLNGTTLKEGTDFTVYYISNIKVGTATVLISGEGSYVGITKATFSITKGDNPMTVKKPKTQTVKYSKLKSKTQTIKAKKAFVVKKAQWKVTYKVTKYDKKAKKKITISKTGNITVKKGLKKCTYKLKLNITATGNDNYNPLTTPVTVKVRVK